MSSHTSTLEITLFMSSHSSTLSHGQVETFGSTHFTLASQCQSLGINTLVLFISFREGGQVEQQTQRVNGNSSEFTFFLMNIVGVKIDEETEPIASFSYVFKG